MFFNSPFDNEQNIKNCEETMRRLCKEAGIIIPEEGVHLRTHYNEFNPVAIQDAFKGWDKTQGVHSIEVTAGCAVTRLHGKKMGDGYRLKYEPRTLNNRGAGREPQPCIVREMPWRDTKLVTLVIFPNEEEKMVIYTAHAGPSMPPNLNHEEWQINALAFKAKEISN